MNIIIFGATGGTGRHLVAQALHAGHTVTAFVRDPAKLPVHHSQLIRFQGDVLDGAAVANALAGQEAVLSALGATRPPVPHLLETAANNLIAGMHAHAVRRLIAITGAGVRSPHDRPKLSDRLIVGLLNVMAGAVLRDAEAGITRLCASDVDWTIVRFPRLVDGPHTGQYRVGYVGPDSGMQISRADGADFILKELAHPRYGREMPVVSY